MLVLLGMVLVLGAVFVPYVLSLREAQNRTTCANNLRQILVALQGYAKDNQHYLPRVVYDAERQPNAWTAFTGADCDDPFLDGAQVQPNDVTASLWLLVRTQKLSPRVFVCPSTDARADLLTNEQGQRVPAEKRGNFRGPGNLSYGYANPFSALSYRVTDAPGAYFALVADRGPGEAATQVKADEPPLVVAKGNSPNHPGLGSLRRGWGTGQNVLFSYGNVEFMTTPFCGVGWMWGDRYRGVAPSTGDNIYTALRGSPLEAGHSPAANEPGVVGRNVGPAWKDDAYLVP